MIPRAPMELRQAAGAAPRAPEGLLGKLAAVATPAREEDLPSAGPPPPAPTGLEAARAQVLAAAKAQVRMPRGRNAHLH